MKIAEIISTIGGASGLVAIITFIITRFTNARNAGKSEGLLLFKLEQIGNDQTELKSELREIKTSQNNIKDSVKDIAVEVAIVKRDLKTVFNKHDDLKEDIEKIEKDLKDHINFCKKKNAKCGEKKFEDT